MSVTYFPSRSLCPVHYYWALLSSPTACLPKPPSRPISDTRLVGASCSLPLCHTLPLLRFFYLPALVLALPTCV